MGDDIYSRAKYMQLYNYSSEIFDTLLAHIQKHEEQVLEIAELKAKNQRLEARLNKDHI